MKYPTCKVYIATSIDGYIADKNGGVDWLETVPNPAGVDLGFADFMAGVDALLMGRKTYDFVAGYEGPWPYPKPVFVLSRTLTNIPARLQGKVELVSGELLEVLEALQQRGYQNLYVDGGRLIQSLLQANLIDELTITTIPILLGGGIPLFEAAHDRQGYELLTSTVYLEQLVMSTWRRKV